MIESISMWAKNITLAVVVVSLFEMLLPNQKMKQYMKVVMGIYILFNILSPLVGKDIFLDVNEIVENTKSQIATTEPVDQTSMDQRLKKIGEEELEKDVTKKVQLLGFSVEECQVELVVGEVTKIQNIVLHISKNEQNQQEKQEKNVENTLVEEIQKIKKIKIGQNSQNEQTSDLSPADINQVKKMLMEEYEVSETCLKIN